MTARIPRLDWRVLGVGAAALLVAAFVGAVLGRDFGAGLAIIAGTLLVGTVVSSLPAGIAIWVALLFLSGVTSIKWMPNAASLLVLAAWIGTIRARRTTADSVIAPHRHLFETMVLFLVWLTLSLGWASSRSLVLEDLIVWCVAAVLYVVVATTLSTPARVRVVAAAFVAGAVVAVGLGFIQQDIRVLEGALETAQQSGERFQGGSDDPNYLAAGLVPAIALALGLRAGTRRLSLRLILLGASAVLAIGLAATESRGGFIAAGVALVGALLIYRRRRLWVVLVILVVAGGSGVWLSNSESTVQRLRSVDEDRGSGRVYLWSIAWRMSLDHPVSGVGLNNYVLRSREYAGEVGTTDKGELIFASPKVAHSVYLELLAETGVVGLALFGAFVLGSLRAAWLGASLFERQGDRELAFLSRSVIVAAVGLLGAAAFLTIGWDRRLWFLLALGPALRVMAERREATALARSVPRRELVSA